MKEWINKRNNSIKDRNKMKMNEWIKNKYETKTIEKERMNKWKIYKWNENKYIN